MDDEDPVEGLVRRRIDPNPETAEYDFLSIVADVEGTTIDDLPSLWEDIDNLVQHVFEHPPADDAQVEVSFSYAGYRVSVDQTGGVTLVPVKETLYDG